MRSLLQFLVRLHAGLASRFRNVWYRALGVRMSGYCWLRRISIPRLWHLVSLDRVSLDDGVVLLVTAGAGEQAGEPRIVIHENVYVNRCTILDAVERIEIGADTMIGPHCFITDGNHGFAAGTPVKDQPMESRPVSIGRDVWIGAGVQILAGARLGDGCVIGAGAVVNGEIPPGAVAAGVPAKVIKMRPTAA